MGDEWRMSKRGQPWVTDGDLILNAGVGFNNVPHEIMSTGYFFIVNIVHGQYLLILMCPGHNLPMK